MFNYGPYLKGKNQRGVAPEEKVLVPKQEASRSGQRLLYTKNLTSKVWEYSGPPTKMTKSLSPSCSANAHSTSSSSSSVSEDKVFHLVHMHTGRY